MQVPEKISSVLDWMQVFATRIKQGDIPHHSIEEYLRNLQELKDLWATYQSDGQQLEERLNQAAALSELGTMAAAIFHEMNQPLLGIKGFAELILEQLKRGETGKIADWVGEIRSQASRMQDMQKNVGNFLFRREDMGEPVSVAWALEGALRLFTYRVRNQKVKFELNIPPELPAVRSSQVQLIQILVNLFGNALDATEGREGATIRVVASADNTASKVRIMVADNGVGIPEEMQEQIFVPFFTTKKEKGTGLGLYISRSLAEANDGDLTLKDPESFDAANPPSTVFELQLPIEGAVPRQVAKAAEPIVEEPPPQTPETPPAVLQLPPLPTTGSYEALQTLNMHLMEFAGKLNVTRRVLVVDDEPIIQRVLTEFLNQQGMATDAALDAEESLKMLTAAEYAVVLTDKNLPGMDGIELLKKIKDSWPQIEVVVITGYTSVESALDAIGEGAFDYIPKPFPSLSYIADKVRGALARHDFEVRILTLVEHLSLAVKAQVTEMGADQQQDWVKRLREALAVYSDKDNRGSVVVIGPNSLARAVENLGYEFVHLRNLEEAFSRLKTIEVQVVIVAEGEGGIDGAEAVRQIHSINADIGVFVIANRASLKQIVSAIGIGVGDYLIRPLEGRELFGPRLARLVARQQRIMKTRKLLESLKMINIDIIAVKSKLSGA